jgi:PKD repeat protein
MLCADSKEGDMVEQFRLQAVRAVVGSLAVIAAGCGSDSGLSPAGPSPVFSAGTIEIAPAGAIVGTSVTLESRFASDPSGGSMSYHWDFGDGSTATGEAATHVYATAGDFFATVTVSSSEAGSAMTSLHIPVRSLTAQWSEGPGRVSITQDGLDLRGTYRDDSRQGTVGGRVSETGTVTFTVTSPGLAPVTFTGTAGPDVATLVGAANGPDVVNRPWTLARN